MKNKRARGYLLTVNFCAVSDGMEIVRRWGRQALYCCSTRQHLARGDGRRCVVGVRDWDCAVIAEELDVSLEIDVSVYKNYVFVISNWFCLFYVFLEGNFWPLSFFHV